jgi:hypothetical protein
MMMELWQKQKQKAEAKAKAGKWIHENGKADGPRRTRGRELIIVD